MNIKTYLLLPAIMLIPLTLCGQNNYPYTISERDPMSPLINEQGEILLKTETHEELTIVLQGIMFSQNESTVIINDEIYRQGDYVGKNFIKKIEPNGVLVENEDKEYFLKWEGQ